jgi:F0F1-type ATP synthase epsilon subunit
MFNCRILTKEKPLFSSRIESATIPARNGQMQILEGHAESFVSLSKGKIILQVANGKIKDISVKAGLAHIYNNSLVILI